LKFDIWEFCRRLNWKPTAEQVPFLRAAMDPKTRRIGLSEPLGFGAGDVTAVIALWRMLMVPGCQCFIVTSHPSEARCWMVNAEAIMSQAEPTTHSLFRFATDKSGICLTADKANMGIVAAAPGDLAVEAVEKFYGKPITLVMGGFQFIAKDYIQAAAKLLNSSTQGLWAVILPRRAA